MPLGDSAESMGAFVWIEATSPAGGGKDSRRPPEGAGGVAAVGRGVAHGANAVPDGPDWLQEIKYDGLYEASRVKKFLEINIFSFPAFQEARVA